MENKLIKLKEARDRLLPESKFWNRQRLFLSWAFCAAIILTAGIEIAKVLSKNYYIYGMIILFLFGFIIIWKITKIIERESNDRNKTIDILNKEIKNLEKRK